uniref:hypothetical protein n=1 Tax=Enterocloster aldenensis TaxID=358742 RepID=UPI0022E66B21
MNAKKILLAILVCLDIGFLANFQKYDLTNRLVCLAAFLLTILLYVNICMGKLKHAKKAVQDKEQEIKVIQTFNAGNIPHIETNLIILKKGEFASFESPAYMSITKNKLVGSKGSGGGVSVRVAKGLYVRSGSSGSRKIYKDVEETYPGTFIVTNKRMVFLNPQKGFEITYPKLTSVYSDGNSLSLQSQSKGYNVSVSTPSVVAALIQALAKQN